MAPADRSQKARTNLSKSLGLVVLCLSLNHSTNRQKNLPGPKFGNKTPMKLDLEMLEKMVAAGASGEAVLAVIKHAHEQYEAKRAKKRPIEANSKRKARSGHKRTRGGPW
jgi:hypothetical protein